MRRSPEKVKVMIPKLGEGIDHLERMVECGRRRWDLLAERLGKMGSRLSGGRLCMYSCTVLVGI
jgi:hypothetical protein